MGYLIVKAKQRGESVCAVVIMCCNDILKIFFLFGGEGTPIARATMILDNIFIYVLISLTIY